MAIRYKNPQTGEYEVIKIPVMKGDQGHAGIHVGTDAPPTTDVKLWFDPSDTDNDVDLANRLDTTLTACYDYMGNDRGSIKAAADANVDWLLGEVNTAHYEGQQITATETIEGHAKNAILKGQTLVNLIDFESRGTSSNVVKNGDTFSLTSTNKNAWFNSSLQLNGMSHEKTYIACWDSLTYTHQDSRGMSQLIGIYSYDINGNQITVKATTQNQTTNYLIFTLPSNSDLSKTYFRVHATTFTGEQGSTTTIKGMKVLEYQDGIENWDIPYFEGMKSVQMPGLTTTGKNFYNPKNSYVVGAFNQDIKNKMSLEPNTTYTFYANGRNWVGAELYNKENVKTRIIGGLSTSTSITFTTTNEEVSVILQYLNGEGTVIENTDFTGVQLEEGSVATPYEPYQTNILTVNEDVELRDIKDTKYFNGSSIGKNFTDVLDYTNGELKIQTNKITMDGSKQPILSSSKENVSIFKYKPNDLLIERSFDGGDIFNCDKLNFVSSVWEKDEEGYCYSNNDGIMFSISNNKFTDINEYLSQNPITFIYPLAQESIKTVDLSDNHVYSYKDVTHYDCSSAEGSLVPTLSIDVPTNLSALVTKQRNQIETLKEENKGLNQELQLAITSSEEGDNELLAQSFELDFRLMEVEFALDLPMAATFRLGGKAMAMTPYEMAKKLILAGNYDRADMEHKLDVYVSKKRMTEAERQELIQLMNEKEGIITTDPIESEVEETDAEHEAVTIPLH